MNPFGKFRNDLKDKILIFRSVMTFLSTWACATYFNHDTSCATSDFFPKLQKEDIIA